jgi:hypothetical protein
MPKPLYNGLTDMMVCGISGYDGLGNFGLTRTIFCPALRAAP